MLGVIIALILNSIIVLLASYIVPGIKLYSFFYAVIVAGVIGLANALVHHILVWMGIPPNYLTYSLFTLLFTAGFILAISYWLPGIEVDGFKWALIYAVVIAVLNASIHSIIHHF
ncbi:MAG: phage holin family protein [Chlamydiota bacterium]|nr:phage holin family protein [Chlamydiota bacterium]